MKIKSKDYFNMNNKFIESNYSDINIQIIVCDSEDKIDEMINFFNFINNDVIPEISTEYIESTKFVHELNQNEIIVSMDFEFNKKISKIQNDDEPNPIPGREIAIFQILIEYKNDYKIFLFYPPSLKTSQLNELKKLLCSNNIKKVIHGGESLDIPYLFNYIFVNFEEKKSFTENLIDTKYLCEFKHVIEDNKDKKCKIYHFLREMEVINDNQMKMLQKNEEDMGPIWFINLDIKNLSENVIKYASFDVLYLGALYKSVNRNKHSVTLDRKFIQKIDDDSIYYSDIIPKLGSYIFIYKFLGEKMEEINKLNLNYFKLNSDNSSYLNFQNVTFNDIFNLYNNWVRDDYGKFFNLQEINYFKKFLQNIIRFFVYLCLYELFDLTFITEITKLEPSNYEILVNYEEELININNKFYFSYLLQLKEKIRKDMLKIQG